MTNYGRTNRKPVKQIHICTCCEQELDGEGEAYLWESEGYSQCCNKSTEYVDAE